MEEKEEKQKEIHIQTYDLGPHRQRVIYLPKYAQKNRKYTMWVWVLASIIIGVSVFAFVVNSLESGYKIVKGLINGDLSINIETKETPKEEVLETTQNLGSEESISLAEKLALAKVAKEGEYYFKNAQNTLPKTNALSFVVGDLDTGEIILEKNGDMVLPIASVSKLITALVAQDVFKDHDEIIVSRSSVETYGNQGGLTSGEKIIAKDLFYPLLMESSNDAAEVFAESYGRNDFLKKMNEKVKSLDMKKTSFWDPSGLSANNVSTSKDLFILSEYLFKEQKNILDYSLVRNHSIRNHSWVNANRFLGRSTFLGGKNGYTYEANRTGVALFEVPIDGFRKKVAIVVLKTNDREGDIDIILRFLQNQVGFFPEVK